SAFCLSVSPVFDSPHLLPTRRPSDRPYLATYGLSARELAQKLVQEVLQRTGITATAGIGSNLYLCKVAMDIVAKHVKPDRNGVRSEEHTSELQSRFELVCRLLLEKKN